MKLPNGELAEISMEKLIGYCLNPEHSRGKNQARVFRSRLGITAENAEVLRSLISQAALEGKLCNKRSRNSASSLKWIGRYQNGKEHNCELSGKSA